MTTQSLSASAEWRAHWPLILATFMGFSFPSVAVHATGLFIEPLQQEFGWSRAQISAGLTLAGVLTVPLSPFVGALIDRWGSRVLAVPGMALTAIALAAISTANGSFPQWMLLWGAYGLMSLMVKSTIWTAAVSNTFNAGRGVALAVTLSGTALAQIVTPPLTHMLLGDYGWRQTYVLLALLWGTPAFLLTFLFLVDARENARRAGKSMAETGRELGGLTAWQAARSLPLLRIGLATLISLTLGSGLLVHKVPLLSEAGVDRGTAAWLASLGGVAAILGKFATGWLMDRFDAGRVGAATLTLLAFAFLPLLEPFRTPETIILSMFILGYAGGTTLQICTQLTGIYGGLRNFGKIFGVMASIISLSAGLGPMLTGYVYDISGSYTPIIIAAIPASLLSGLLLLGLGAYPDWSAKAKPA